MEQCRNMKITHMISLISHFLLCDIFKVNNYHWKIMQCITYICICMTKCRSQLVYRILEKEYINRFIIELFIIGCDFKQCENLENYSLDLTHYSFSFA